VRVVRIRERERRDLGVECRASTFEWTAFVWVIWTLVRRVVYRWDGWEPADVLIRGATGRADGGCRGMVVSETRAGGDGEVGRLAVVVGHEGGEGSEESGGSVVRHLPLAEKSWVEGQTMIRRMLGRKLAGGRREGWEGWCSWGGSDGVTSLVKVELSEMAREPIAFFPRRVFLPLPLSSARRDEAGRALAIA
jgi:hypothetical protein